MSLHGEFNPLSLFKMSYETSHLIDLFLFVRPACLAQHRTLNFTFVVACDPLTKLGGVVPSGSSLAGRISQNDKRQSGLIESVQGFPSDCF